MIRISTATYLSRMNNEFLDIKPARPTAIWKQLHFMLQFASHLFIATCHTAAVICAHCTTQISRCVVADSAVVFVLLLENSLKDLIWCHAATWEEGSCQRVLGLGYVDVGYDDE